MKEDRTMICKECRRKFEVSRPSRKNIRVFCSRKCYYESKRGTFHMEATKNKMRRMLNNEELEILKNLYLTNENVMNICKILNCSTKVIYRSLKENKILLRKISPQRTLELEEKSNEIIRDYQEGLSIKEIAIKNNVDYGIIHRILKQSIILRKGGFKKGHSINKGRHPKTEFKIGHVNGREIKFTQGQISKIISLYEKDLLSAKQVGKIMGCSHAPIERVLHESKINTSIYTRAKKGYARGKRKAPNKGKHIVSAGSFKKGHKVPKEWKDNLSKLHKGEKKSKSFREKRREYMKEKIKQNPQFMIELQKKSVEANRGAKRSEEAKKKMSIARKDKTYEEIYGEEKARKLKDIASKRMRGNTLVDGLFIKSNNPFYGKHHTEETKKILSDNAKKRTGEKNSFFGKKHKAETIRKILSNPNRYKKPNKAEIQLLELLNSNGFDYKFVGDGKLILGNHNPDFVNGQNKKIIELWGFYHTERFCIKHNCPKWRYIPEELANIYKNYGYLCLIIRYEELFSPQTLLNKISNFESGIQDKEKAVS